MGDYTAREAREMQLRMNAFVIGLHNGFCVLFSTKAPSIIATPYTIMCLLIPVCSWAPPYGWLHSQNCSQTGCSVLG